MFVVGLVFLFLYLTRPTFGENNSNVSLEPPMKWVEDYYLDKFCDADTSCSDNLTCIKFPAFEKPVCVAQEAIDNYCPEGSSPIIAESYPLQLFCQ